MHNDWILDVLADLRSFAQQNGLTVLAEQLDDTRLVAATELASKVEGSMADERTCASAARYDSVPAGGGAGPRHIAGEH